MSASHFTITEHTSPCSYIRQFPHGAKNDNAELQLAVKEYRPRENPVKPDEHAVTIIACHANGFPKECYEPLWDDLLKASTGFKIRSIWIADVAHQGSSYALNTNKLGDDPHWFDHSRDLFLMMNHFRDRMKPPFVGIGHSMGGAQIVHLALMHPRLFHSLILIEPVLQDFPPPGPNAAMFSSLRRETWPSRALAESQIRKNAFFEAMDARVVDRYLNHALRDVDSTSGKVTLATPKAQEAWSYVRPNFQSLPEDATSEVARRNERLVNPEYVPFSKYSKAVFTRPEGVLLLQSLPNLRPQTMFLYGDFSHINFDEIREIHVDVTGAGHGGNGGKGDGGVEEVVLEDVGHLCCFEGPGKVAESLGRWVGKEVGRWEEEKKFWEDFDSEKSTDRRTKLSGKWMKGVREDANIERRNGKGTSKL